MGTARTLPVVHERAPGEGLGEQSPAEAPVDARPETKRPPYGVNESVRLEEVDESCHGEASLDLDGPAVTWGLDHKVSSAQECCDRCKAQARGAREKGEGARACNSWVFCPLPECWAPDIWNHTLGEYEHHEQAEYHPDQPTGPAKREDQHRGAVPAGLSKLGRVSTRTCQHFVSSYE